MIIDFAAMRQALGSGRRLRQLQNTADLVRQFSLGAGGEVEGWKIARLMREAVTMAQVTTAERRLSIWLRVHALWLPRVA